MGNCAKERYSEGCFALALTWGYFTVALTVQCCEMGPVKKTKSGKATAMEAPGVTGKVDGICQSRRGKGNLMSCDVRGLRQALRSIFGNYFSFNLYAAWYIQLLVYFSKFMII